jgi:hypothetical protein
MPLTVPALVLTLTSAVPALGAAVGDRILIRPGHKHPLVLQRDLPDDAALIIAALDAGQFELSSPTPPPLSEILQAVSGDPLSQSAELPPRSPRLHLE